MENSYIHMFIYVEFKIVHMFLKGRHSKYKPAYALILSARFFFFLVASERILTRKFAGHSLGSSLDILLSGKCRFNHVGYSVWWQHIRQVKHWRGSDKVKP